MKQFLFYFAASGWTLALIVHLLTLTGMDINSSAPYVWVLHIGIFAVWIPAILKLRKDEELQAFQQSQKQRNTRTNPIRFFKIMFRHTPTWLTVLAIGGFFYTFINMVMLMPSQSGVPDIQNGHYVLHNHGQLIKTLTAQEYHYYKASVIRGFSGHWLAFYGIAAAILFPFNRQTNDLNQQN
jgi:hypothetical protein